MNQLTLRDIIAHQNLVPWPNQRQVEQDLLLCQAMVALFSDDFLKTQIAMRGGTLLHKIHLAPASRYSEDIDLVVIGDRPEDHINKAIQRVLGSLCFWCDLGRFKSPYSCGFPEVGLLEPAWILGSLTPSHWNAA